MCEPIMMPKAGYRKRKVQPGSHEEREKLLKAAGVTAEKKAILLAAAVAAVQDGLAAASLTDRLRAASMALGLLGARPSRNPMAPQPKQDAMPPEPDWLTGSTLAATGPGDDVRQPAEGEDAASGAVLGVAPPAALGSVDPGSEAGEAGF